LRLRRKLLPGLENGDVTAFRDIDDGRLQAALSGEIGFQSFPQLAGFHANDIVFTDVVVGRPAEYLGADQLFPYVFGLS